MERGYGGVCAAGAARIQHRRAAERGWEACGGRCARLHYRELGSALGLRRALEGDDTRDNGLEAQRFIEPIWAVRCYGPYRVGWRLLYYVLGKKKMVLPLLSSVLSNDPRHRRSRSRGGVTGQRPSSNSTTRGTPWPVDRRSNFLFPGDL